MIKRVKHISQSGYCSRREATRLIIAGKVFVNDQKIITPSHMIDEEEDKIQISGKILKKQKPEIWVFHKPTGVITSHSDPHHDKTIFDLLPKNLDHLKIIGRLDLMTSGLLLLTNHSQVQSYLEQPKHEVPRTYHVRVFGNLPKELIPELKKGVVIEDFEYDKIKCKILKSTRQNHWLELTLKEGKNREIRRIMEFFNLKVSKLHRSAYGAFTLGTLPLGQVRKASDEDVAVVLRDIDAHH